MMLFDIYGYPSAYQGLCQRDAGLHASGLADLRQAREMLLILTLTTTTDTDTGLVLVLVCNTKH